MHKNTQLLWIAEAEARRFQETVLTQRAASEPQVSVVSAVRGSARRNRWRRLFAQLALVAARCPGTGDQAPPACHVNDAIASEERVSTRSVVAEIVPTSFDGQRG